MRRRHLLAALPSALPARLGAQPASRLPIVGFLHPGLRSLGSLTVDALKRDMGEQGFVDGQTIRLEERWAEGQLDRLPALARELVALGPSVIIAVARPAIEAARLAGPGVPIVASDLENDPVASGYATSLGKPGGSITGLFLDAPTLCGKWVQQIGELVPGLKRVAILWDTSTGRYQHDAVLPAATAAGLTPLVIEYRGGAPIGEALAAGLPAEAQALIMLGSPLIRQAAAPLAAVTMARRLPALGPFRSFPAAGGLMSYGTDLDAMYRRLVPFVARVLRGAKPGDLPIEQPTKFELVLNLKTAKALDLAISPALLAGADELIEG